MNSLTKGFVLSFVLFSYAFSTNVSDSYIGYSFELPENWAREIKSKTHHAFYDTTATYQSYINIIMTDYTNDTAYKTPESWTQAHFIAYLITIKSSISADGTPLSDPFGTTVYYDSTTSLQSGNKAMELYANFYSLATSESWSEFVRYTSLDKRGYEFYTIGDTADMKKNIGMYIALTNYIFLDSSKMAIGNKVILNRTTSIISNRTGFPQIHDLLGRNSGYSRLMVNHAKGVYVKSGVKAVHLDH